MNCERSVLLYLRSAWSLRRFISEISSLQFYIWKGIIRRSVFFILVFWIISVKMRHQNYWWKRSVTVLLFTDITVLLFSNCTSTFLFYFYFSDEEWGDPSARGKSKQKQLDKISVQMRMRVYFSQIYRVHEISKLPFWLKTNNFRGVHFWDFACRDFWRRVILEKR